jgi:hypothetical protein
MAHSLLLIDMLRNNNRRLFFCVLAGISWTLLVSLGSQ